MKFALIPWDKSEYGDTIFYKTDESGLRVLKDDWIVQMRSEFMAHGDEFHTVDVYTDLEQVDYFLFMSMDWEWYRLILKHGGEQKMIYCNAEPPVVTPKNSLEGFQYWKRFFKYIMTWNRAWVDNQAVFLRNNPYIFRDHRGNVTFQDKKLITGISRNKRSTHPDELYSERERAYSYYENRFPDEFQFYGTRWDATVHPGYGGAVADKYAIYQKYKFAICYENMQNIQDYITEKIWDCFVSGIVPIYAGASNIEEVVPRECFIARKDFQNYDDLTEFLLDMDEAEYNRYLEAAKQLLETDIASKTSGNLYAKYIYSAVQQNREFHVSVMSRMYVVYTCVKETLLHNIKQNLRKMIGRP